jgi:putative transposase
LSILGCSINITNKLNPKQAQCFAQWIGHSNVIRNQKINEFKRTVNNENKAYAQIKSNEDFGFLNDVPSQLLRNASSNVFEDLMAFKKGIRDFPKKKNKYDKRKCIITKELYNVKHLNDKESIIVIYYKNTVYQKNILFSIIVPHINIRNQLIITRKGAKFTLSFGYDIQKEVRSNDSILDDYSYLSKEDLDPLTLGVDGGVKISACSNNGDMFYYSQKEQENMKAIDQRINRKKRYLSKQKTKNKNATQKCESNRQKRKQNQIAKLSRKISEIRNNFLHHTSKHIANITPKILVVEDLKLMNMTKKPKQKMENGVYIQNGARAKAGLNKAMLNVALGGLYRLTLYKLNHQDKAMLKVPPMYTSQIHFKCKGKNTLRPKQDTLVCLDCNEEVHADVNAADNIKEIGINIIVEKTFARAKSRKVSTRKIKRNETTSCPVSS